MLTYLITGATGYLGRYVASTLLRLTAARLVCIVRRSARQPDSMARIDEKMRKSGVWREAYRDRIEVIEGDLELPRLGLKLNDYQWSRISREANAVFHMAGDVSFYKPYSQLRNANVRSMIAVADLARASEIPVHYSSSASIGKCVPRFDDGVPEGILTPRENEILSPGYAESKLCAELLLERCEAEYSIYRLPRLTPASISCGLNGHNNADLMSLLIKSCVQIGEMPEIKIADYLLPCDMASDLLVRLALKKTNRQVYHLTPDEPLTLEDVMSQHALKNLKLVSWER